MRMFKIVLISFLILFTAKALYSDSLDEPARPNPGWQLIEQEDNSGTTWWCGDENTNTYDNNWLKTLRTPNVEIQDGDSLFFRIKLNLDDPASAPVGYDARDGVNLWMNVDNSEYFLVSNNMLSTPYNADNTFAFNHTLNSQDSFPSWSGFMDWVTISVDLAIYSGSEVSFLFSFASDDMYGGFDAFRGGVQISAPFGIGDFLFCDEGECSDTGFESHDNYISPFYYTIDLIINSDESWHSNEESQFGNVIEYYGNSSNSNDGDEVVFSFYHGGGLLFVNFNQTYGQDINVYICNDFEGASCVYLNEDVSPAFSDSIDISSGDYFLFADYIINENLDPITYFGISLEASTQSQNSYPSCITANADEYLTSDIGYQVFTGQWPFGWTTYSRGFEYIDEIPTHFEILRFQGKYSQEVVQGDSFTINIYESTINDQDYTIEDPYPMPLLPGNPLYSYTSIPIIDQIDDNCYEFTIELANDFPVDIFDGSSIRVIQIVANGEVNDDNYFLWRKSFGISDDLSLKYSGTGSFFPNAYWGVSGNLNFCFDDYNSLNTESLMKTFELTSAPNPFNSTVSLKWNSDCFGVATIRVFDYLGRKVSQFNVEESIGINKANWSADRLSSGVYFIVIENKYRTLSQKVLHIK
jgi:hypothetical protein